MLIKKDFNSFSFKLILNQLHKQDNVALGSQICNIIKKHLGLHVILPATYLTMNMFTTPSVSGCVF